MSAEPDGPEDRLRRFATIWSRAVFPVTSTSLTRPEFEEQLLPLARRLSEALRARTFEAAEGRAVGAALVAAHCTDPEALSRALDCVDAYLVLYCGEDGPKEALRTRSARLQHAIAAGYAEALRERTLAEQQAISQAALTARSAVAEALHDSEARFRAVFEGAAIGIGIADLEGNILQVNGALLRMFGGSEQTMRGRRVFEWTHAEDGPQVWRLYEELVRGEREHYHVEKAFYRPDGTALWTNLTVSLLRDADGAPQYQLALMEDTTERRLLNLRLRYEATHDALTGLPNRTLFFERLEKALAAGRDSASGSATSTSTASRPSTTASGTRRRPAARRGRRPPPVLRDGPRRDGRPAGRRRVRGPHHRPGHRARGRRTGRTHHERARHPDQRRRP